ncbi:hypothetical protein [Priestia endophytica]|uniref:hypothetical protein n=1 Tax=Priestia endophytica TaxID=135735 RepID=UPI002281A2E9|nr:hypothetical protein [Priestia endophytica]MCY8234831.1 hypothetical protein [Priestia endophytica]
MKIANELDISSGKIVELVDEYRAKVAPLAEKWAEWKEGKDEVLAPQEEPKEEQPEKAQEPSQEELSAQIYVGLPAEEEAPQNEVQEDKDHGYSIKGEGASAPSLKKEGVIMNENSFPMAGYQALMKRKE